MWHEDIYYGWNEVYLISGLCKEDFTHDFVGSHEHFKECLVNWRNK